MDKKEKIKIFVDAHTFDDEFQGSRTFIREMYRLLAQKETLELYIGAYNTDQLSEYFPTVDADHFIQFKSRSSIIRLLIDIPTIIKKYRIQYAHFQYMVPLYKNCRYIVTMHDVIFREYPGNFLFLYRLSKTVLYKIGALKADILTTVSFFSARSVQKYLSTDEKKVHLVPDAVRDIYFEPYDKLDVKKTFASRYGFDKYILFVSRIEPRKNHAFLLQAFIDLELHTQGYYLVLLGHKSINTPAFDKIMDQLPDTIRPFIFIKSDIPDEELLLFYRAATVFVYPSKAEGFGIPPLEAAAARIPVICSNTSAMSDFNFFGKNHIAPFDYPSLKNTLHEVLHNPPDESTLSGIAGAIRQRYSWTQSAERLYQLIMDDYRGIHKSNLSSIF
jgi:glycosyltransferase involved in cell wall biosynthesis